jgi:hypothetical protein
MIAVDRAYQIVAEVVYDAIKNIYIPRLQVLAKRATGDEKQKILELIEEYKKYADPRTAEGQDMATLTAKVVGLYVSKYSKSGIVVEDVIQQIAGDFFATGGATGEAMAKFKAEDGPVQLKHFWSNTLRLHSAYRFREEERKTGQRQRVQPLKNDEGGYKDPTENLPAEERDEMEDKLRRLGPYFEAHVDSVPKADYLIEIAKEIFGIWYPKLLRKSDYEYGPEEVRPLWESMRVKKGEKTTRSSFYDGLKIIKDIVEQFFVEEKRHQRAASGKTIVERVARAESRIRFAKWMLGE